MSARIIETNDSPLQSIDVDGITVDLIENALKNAREEMDALVSRTALSPGIREQGDCFPMMRLRKAISSLPMTLICAMLLSLIYPIGWF
jgi:N-methylhydantoinase B